MKWVRCNVSFSFLDARQIDAGEEHEHSSIANIEMQIGLDDSEQPVEALSHIDGLGVQVDLDQ